MSFLNQRAVYYLVESAIPVFVANWLYKTPAILKCHQFKDSWSDNMEPKGLKCYQLDLRDDKEEVALNKFESEGKGEDIRYILFPKKSQIA